MLYGHLTPSFGVCTQRLNCKRGVLNAGLRGGEPFSQLLTWTGIRRVDQDAYKVRLLQLQSTYLTLNFQEYPKSKFKKNTKFHFANH